MIGDRELSPFEGTLPVTSLGRDAVTLVEGQTFCLSDRAGDMSPALAHGLFLLDTRVLSRWELRVNGRPVEPLTADVSEPFAATFVGRARPEAGRADSDVVVFRDRAIGSGMRESLTVTNHGLDAADLAIELRSDVDFADLFAVKEGRVDRRVEHRSEVRHGRLLFREHHDDGAAKVVEITASAAMISDRCISWTLTLPAGSTWETCVEVAATLGGTRVEPRFRCGVADLGALPAQRLATWRATLPSVDTDHSGLATAIEQAGEDLGALRIFDPDHPDVPILAAGAPWFMTVFGRDSLLTSWMTLLADPALARGVLETLARFQGSDIDPRTEEEPGKILHEIRFGKSGGLALGGGDRYFGSVDATPLFVMLLGELRRWDLEDAVVERLLPHADRALAWISDYGDRDGDGYVEYQRHHPRGLANQGWKDSWDAIRHRDGTLARTPIALCEVQAYTYAAYLARAHLARERGDAATFEHYRDKATTLRRRFNEDFWLEDLGWYALGLDADKRPIGALASNIGHCLWTGIVDRERAHLVASRLLSDAMFSGWGVRTLATSMPAFNPVSYHNGSVWPHDNALCAAGLARYGFVEEAHRIIGAQLHVAEAHGGRLPELFAGFERGRPRSPAAYPASCSPQAWASAAPLLWLRTLLRLDPSAPQGSIHLQPDLPSWLGRLRVEGILVAGQRLTVAVDSSGVEVSGVGHLDVITHARPPLSALIGDAQR